MTNRVLRRVTWLRSRLCLDEHKARYFKTRGTVTALWSSPPYLSKNFWPKPTQGPHPMKNVALFPLNLERCHYGYPYAPNYTRDQGNALGSRVVRVWRMTRMDRSIVLPAWPQVFVLMWEPMNWIRSVPLIFIGQKLWFTFGATACRRLVPAVSIAQLA